MRRHIIYLLLAMFVGCSMPVLAQSEDDYDESIRMPVRRLHPEREREKARKKRKLYNGMIKCQLYMYF